MPNNFLAALAEASMVAELGMLQPANPYATAAYFETRRRSGDICWVVGLGEDGRRLQDGCGAFLRYEQTSRTLFIPAAPGFGADSEFWPGLRAFCRARGVNSLVLHSRGAAEPALVLPDTAASAGHLDEIVVTPTPGDDSSLPQRLARAGIVIRRRTDPEAVAQHRALLALQTVLPEPSEDPNESWREQLALVNGAAAEIVQACRDDMLVASAFVLRAPAGGHCESLGATPEVAASVVPGLLLESIATGHGVERPLVLTVAAEAAELLPPTLAVSNSPHRAVHAALPSTWRAWSNRARRLARHAIPAARARARVGHWRMFVYAAEPDGAGLPAVPAGWTITPLSGADLAALDVDDEGFRTRQAERLSRFGDSHAWAIRIDGELAHVSWLLPQEAIRRDVPQVLDPAPDDGEITCCETLPRFRRRGLFDFAIRHLLGVASRSGMRRIYMKAADDNIASQHGIVAAGFQLLGPAEIVALPFVSQRVVWRRFG